MIFNVGFLRRFLFGLPITGMDKLWAGYGTETEARKQLRLSSTSFIEAYNTSLEADLGQKLFSILRTFDQSFRGFAYEGAGMGMAIIDYTSFSKRSRLLEFVDQAPNYTILAHIGAGFAIAVLNRDLQGSLAPMNPLQRWWAIDGYGFYCGLFRWEKVKKQWTPKKVKGYGQRAFDRGLGRSIWFRLNDDIDAITELIKTFPQHRQADLWSGVGVASTYAGGVERTVLETIKANAGQYKSHVALGASLAAMTRYFSENIVEHNDLACSVYCGMTAENTAKLVINTVESLTIDPKEPVFATQPIFETFRESVRSHLALLTDGMANDGMENNGMENNGMEMVPSNLEVSG